MQGNLQKTMRVVRTGVLLIGACLVAFLAFCPAPAFAQEPAAEGRVVFAHARDIADKAAAVELVRKCKQAGFNVLVLQVKEPDGAVYFNTERFMGVRAPGVLKFDPLKAVLKAAKKEKLTVHAGLCAFLEGPKSTPANDNPEWAALTADGKTTQDLENSPGVWMCPARRPGYADKHLIPLIEELLTKYAVDGIHLDHLSFPGELGPDSYCFCDHCVWEFPRRSRLFYPALPEMRFKQPETVSDPLTNWVRGLTTLPDDYEGSSRKVKAEYMLKGHYIRRGPADIDYFFYTYRTEVIRGFCAELYEHARAVSPKVELSASVYWNAPAAGRFAGQRWTGFGQWFDFLVLDLGRSYLPGDFATYRKLLADVAPYMTRSSRSLVYTYAGLNLEDLYREEREGLATMLAILTDLTKNPGLDVRLPATKLAAAFEKIKVGLKQADKALAADLEDSILSLVKVVEGSSDPLSVYTRIGAKVKSLINRPPAGFYRPQKLREVLQDLRGAGAASVALGPASALSKLKLWDRLPGILGAPGREPYRVRPLRAPSVQIVRLFIEKQEQLARASAEIELLNRRLRQVVTELEPLRTAVDDYRQAQEDKLERLEGARLELEMIEKEYADKLTELERIYKNLKEAPGAPAPKIKPADLEPLAEDADYATLQRKLEQTMEELKIAIGQHDRANEIAMQLRASVEKAHLDIMQQKQEYLYYISFIIALVCIGLAVVFVISLVRHRR
jgi:hypothetical protein